MKKKLILTLLTSVLLLSGCGDSGVPANTAEQTSEPGSAVESEETNDTQKAEEPQANAPQETEPLPTFEEITVIDNESCTIKITGIEPNSIAGYTLNAYLENKSPDTTEMFSVSSASVNGVQCDPFFATEVTPGKKATQDIIFPDNNDIGEFTDIEIVFRAYDSDDWTADDIAKETVHVYPLGEDKASQFVREPQSTDNIILDNEYITVTVTGTEHDALWGYMVNLFLINKSDKEIMVSVNDASVNGYMVDPFYAHSLAPNKCAFSSITWSDNILTENGISEISEIEFLLKAYDNADIMAGDLASETITLNP